MSVRPPSDVALERGALRIGVAHRGDPVDRSGDRTPPKARSANAARREQVEERTKQTLGDNAYADAIEAGRGIDVNDIVHFALHLSA